MVVEWWSKLWLSRLLTGEGGISGQSGDEDVLGDHLVGHERRGDVAIYTRSNSQW